ncbi:MAG: quinone-dependent dihydroorotate dehydrogenase [Salibacteraceae bacterium]
MYRNLLRPLLYALPPETAHYFTAKTLHVLTQVGILKNYLEKQFSLQRYNNLEREVFGIKFPTPVGLAAGFDKDARWIDAFACLGFGFIEVGTLTPLPQPGNPKPRLFRLTEDEALINRMGFNNGGAAAAAARLSNRKAGIPIGGNIGKNKLTPNENAAEDYRKCFRSLNDVVDYFVINVSSPNTPGLRDLQAVESLKKVVGAVLEERAKTIEKKPVLVKVSPDLECSDLERIVHLCMSEGIDGIVATNTTIDRSGLKSSSKIAGERGGLSGKPLREKSTQMIRMIHSHARYELPIIGVGGIHSAKDAIEKFEAGASLVQLYTGFIYEGPELIHRIYHSITSRHE